MNLRRRYRRRALTLLEVVVSMFIFLISSIAIWELVSIGSDRAMDIRQETRTSARCQAKLAELMIGAQALSSTGGFTPYDDDEGKDLQWKVDATEGAGVGLWDVKVWVRKELPNGRVIESFLAQTILDPSVRGTSFDRPNPPPTTTPESTTPPATTP